MPSCNTYHPTWVSLALDVWYLFTAAPAKRSHCSLPWRRGISSPPPLLTLNVNGVAPLGPPAPPLQWMEVHISLQVSLLQHYIYLFKLVFSSTAYISSSSFSLNKHSEVHFLDHIIYDKGPYSQGYGFSSGRLWMWELDCEESWMSKNWCFWTVVLEKAPESPLDSKEIQPANLKGDQPWIFTGRTDADAEAPIFWLSDANRWLIG